MPSIASTSTTPINQSGSYVLSNASAYPSDGYVINGNYTYYGSPGYQEPQRATIADLVGDIDRYDIVVDPVSSATVQSASTTVTLNESWHGPVTYRPIPWTDYSWEAVTTADVTAEDMDRLTDAFARISTCAASVDELSAGFQNLPDTFWKPAKEPEPECVDVDEAEWAELLTES